MQMDGTWSDYWQSRPRKWRHNVGRLRRRLAQHAEVSYIRYRPEGDAFGDGDPRWDLYDACGQVAAQSWQATSATGTTLTHDSVRSFLRDVHAAAARFGGLDLNLLLLDGRPADAAAFGFGLSLSDDLLNRLLFSVTEAELLTLVVGDTSVVDDPIPVALTAGALAAVLPTSSLNHRVVEGILIVEPMPAAGVEADGDRT